MIMLFFYKTVSIAIICTTALVDSVICFLFMRKKYILIYCIINFDISQLKSHNSKGFAQLTQKRQAWYNII